MTPTSSHDKQDQFDAVEGAREALQRAVNFSFKCQHSDGHWCAPVSADATFTAQYVMFKYSIPGLSLDSDAPSLKQWLFHDQKEDGSWGLAPTLPGNVSTSVEAYLALRLLDVPSSHPAMRRARDFILGAGGVAKVRFFTRFFLATFGLFPWTAIPEMPAELILMPTWAKLNIYVLSSWARSTLIPVLVVRHHEPVYALPNGFGRSRGDNDFLDEIWCDPSDKNVPITRDLWGLAFGRDRDAVELFFTLGDKVLASLGGLKSGPQRRLALKKCIQWLLSHQEESGDWAGFFPPIHGSVWALLLEGYSLDDKEVRLGLEALERLAVSDETGKWVQSTVSPCWDTALVANALCDAGAADDERVVKSIEWLKGMQLLVDHGDWRIYSRNSQAGGWSFEYYNTFYPDVDDTAVVIMTLVKQEPSSINSECVSNALEWILGMQNHDGGWGAFDTNNDARWLHKIPFSDMDSLVDPSTSDVTGRMLECFGLLLSHRTRGHTLSDNIRRRLLDASAPALEFLLKEQETCGAWWGRWGNNFNYGTTNVLRGLVEYCCDNTAVLKSAQRAVEWLEGCQNADGGWGETLLSYVDTRLAGQGPSTAAQTAWALDSILRYRPVTDPSLSRGVRWLVENQSVSTISRHKLGYSAALEGDVAQERSTWPIDHYVGTGFPNVLYLGYPFYHHLFPIQALSRYLDCIQVQTQRGFDQVMIPRTPAAGNPSVLMMVLGSRGDIEVFLSIARRLTNCHVRIATHPTHRSMVVKNGFDFYDVGGSPDEFARVLGQNPNVLSAASTLRRSLGNTFRKFWQASVDDVDGPALSSPNSDTALVLREKENSVAQTLGRPFVADIIVSSPASSAHVHAAEKLKIPLVFVSAQPALPTSQFPHFATMTKSNFSPGSWINYISYMVLDLINWLAFGTLFNNLRVDQYAMKPMTWIRATRDILYARIPHIGLWSSHVLPTPPEWEIHPQFIAAGYTSPEADPCYKAPQSLRRFISGSKAKDRPLVHISFGSMEVPNPTRVLATLSDSLSKIQADAVVTRTWSLKWELDAIPSNLYITDPVPHAWLLPQVDGFVHHGGAGHTAAGLRAGVPQMAVPFFLDQYLWAARIHQLGLGPAPLEVRIANVTSAELSRRLEQLLYSKSRQYKKRCGEVAQQVSAEGDGADVAADVIMEQLGTSEGSERPQANCSLLPDLNGHWEHIRSGLKLSGPAAACLVNGGTLSWDDLELTSRVDWDERWSQAARSRVLVLSIIAFVVDTVIKGMNLIFGLVRAGVALDFKVLRSQDSHTKTKPLDNGRRDVVRRARMEQGKFDMLHVRKCLGEEKEVEIVQMLNTRWKALVANHFHARLGEE